MEVATGSFLSPEKPLMWLHPPCSFVYLCINLAATGVKGKAAPIGRGHAEGLQRDRAFCCV